MTGLPPEVAAAIRLGALPDVDAGRRVTVAGHVVGYLRRTRGVSVDAVWWWTYDSPYAATPVGLTWPRGALADLWGDLVYGLGGHYGDAAERIESEYGLEDAVRGRRP